MARRDTDMRRRVEWIRAPRGELAVIHLAGDAQEPTWLLADTPEGMRVFTPHVWTRIESVARTENGLGRHRTGSWLVYRVADQQWPAQTTGIRLVSDQDGARREHVRPRRQVRHDLRHARSLPLDEQLTACDLHRLPVAGNVCWYVLPGDPLLLLLHRAGTSEVAICSGAALIHWDPTLVPTDAPTSWPRVDDPPQRHAMNERPWTTWRQVEAPRGLNWVRGRPPERGADFRGGIRDVEVIHEHCADEERHTTGERGRSWAYPAPHLHTRDGSVICTQADARRADDRNLPWRQWERAADEYQTRAVEYWTSHPSTGHL
ncbi:hypothetical protein Aca07nite_56440 [Actinoplanes capillaceus]|uniref:Uncharacterized protein n=1 Tax=Actinoplanes campanulatus TaxID=113559 RepID=A0ABQ3WQ25_9ACTN|nr:hypothetical protein [Actinoplanes capillaceus]GID48369.1 hypothetical protein Aca07nite_56440 [Actinoplanes capillaceus]